MEPGVPPPGTREITHLEESSEGPAQLITGTWTSVYVDPEWSGNHFMPRQINKYRRVRVGTEMLATVTALTAEKFAGVLSKAPYSLPITKQVGSSINIGGHDIDIRTLGRNEFEVKIRREK